jgi:hydroxyethylthiazole kinase-like uncharacterized protein yjeF
MKVVTAAEMREIDRKTIEELGIPGRVLMERAGLAVVSRIRELFEQRKTVVLAGGGNNGGDGIVVARELFNSGWHVKLIILTKQNKLSPDCLSQFMIAKKIGVPYEFRKEVTAGDLHSALVVDAMLGTGLNKNIEGTLDKVIAFLNNSGSPVISVDIPSGISSDSGQIMGAAVYADCTVTFGLPKRGQLLYPGAEYTARLFVEDIGFPERLLTAGTLKVELPERSDLALLLSERPKYSHKGDYGHILIVAGSRGKTGAALMAAKACLRTGSGLVTIGVPESLVDVYQSRVTEEMMLPLPDHGNGMLSPGAADTILGFLSQRADVLAIGPGIGVSSGTQTIMKEIVQSSRSPMVIDADGLNSIKDKSLFSKAHAPVIITPHPGEMARLLGGRQSRRAELKTRNAEIRANIEKDRINTALSFSKSTGTYLILKGVPTVTAEPEGRAFINSTGNPGMATAGAGDVLTGIVASFVGQGLSPQGAAVLGVYIHGLAGDIAAKDKGEQSLIATDLIEVLPEAFKTLSTT